MPTAAVSPERTAANAINTVPIRIKKKPKKNNLRDVGHSSFFNP